MAEVERDGPPLAIDAPGVREGLSQSQRRAWLLAIGGTLLLCGFVVGANVVKDDATELERSGARRAGVVVAVGRTPVVSRHIEVEFVHDGETRVERVHLNDESPSYRVGQGVTVLVDGDDPTHTSIEGETNQSPWTVWPMIVALVLGGVGTVTGWMAVSRTRVQRRLLSGSSWRRVAIRYALVPGHRGLLRPVLLVSDEDAEHPLALVDARRSRSVSRELSSVPDAEVVGALPGIVVIRAPGSASFTSARPPSTERQRRKWVHAF